MTNNSQFMHDCALRRGSEIQTDSGNGGDDFAELELVQNRGLSCSVKTDHQDSHLLLAPQPVKQLRECETHSCDWVWRLSTGVV